MPDELSSAVKELQIKDLAHTANLKVVETKLDDIQKDIHAIRIALVGDPNQDRASIMMRLDRLEQMENLRSKILWLVCTGVLALLLERLSQVF